MPGLKLKITTAGRHALINAKQTGTQAVTIAAVGLTSAAFVADAELKALPSEIKRLTTIGGTVTAKDTMHVSVRDESNAVYSCYGFGLYLADGTLFAAYGQSALLVEKSGAASVLLAIDVVMADVDTAQITFGDTNFTDPAATVDVPGVVRLSTDAQAIEGLDKERALSPANLIAVLNARLGDAAPTDFIKGYWPGRLRQRRATCSAFALRRRFMLDLAMAWMLISWMDRRARGIATSAICRTCRARSCCQARS